MRMYRFSLRTLSFITALAVLLVTGCGGSSTDDRPSESSTAEPTTSATERTTADPSRAASDAVTDITIQPVGNQMKYKQTAFSVPAGEEITLTFENTATSPAMKHNVVILDTNADDVVQRVGQAGMAAAANDHIPDDDAVLAHTAVSDPGETVSVTFTAPSEPGKYRYICTFPGHYMMMQGTMTVVSA